MYEHYRGQGILSICFFPIVYISLCMIMFNLFLAILIESFITVPDKKEADSDKTALLKIRKFRRQIVNWFERRWKKVKPSRNSLIDIEALETERENSSPLKDLGGNISVS